VLSADQHRRVRELFEAVIERESAEAYAWIAREAADDAAVQQEVRSLLYHHSKAGEFLQQPAAEGAVELLHDDPLQSGSQVGSYTVVREIGRGGMGRVYLARDEKLNRTVALKALAPQLVRNPAFRERLRREARAAAALTHPGICTVYALEELDGDLYLATEFVDGRTLREEIASGQGRSTGEVLLTARQLASALASAHERGIVHRDLKPENVMRTRDGRLKILDFGVARIEERGLHATGAAPPDTHPAPLVTEPGVALGTPAYMAPEQINGETPDARADVFAFGVFMYEYACGVHPFDGSSALAIVARILDSEPRPIASRCPHLPVRLAEVIGRCLRKRRDERYPSAAAIVDALAESHEPVSSGGHVTWWRIHQLIICGLYITAAVLAWLIKAWFLESPVTVGAFIALGAGATIGAVLRGHLLFTERNNPGYLTRERRRARRATMALDILIGGVLALDALLVSHLRALWAVFALSLGLGIALAVLVLEPATTAAAFGEE
jgi:tRNA A-37 threonylcarbamoyl transferase component Bud32